MTSQKIIAVDIDVRDGARAMEQIQRAAGRGSWRIVSLRDLHDTEGSVQWSRRAGQETRRVLVVLEPAAPAPHAGEREETETVFA